MRRALAPALALLALTSGAALSCFNSGFLEGLPCMEDSECGDLHCVDGVCGGAATASTSTSETTEATTSDTAGTTSAGTTTPMTSTEATTSTTEPTTMATTDDSSTTDTTTGEPTCGDGEIEGDEACDDGGKNGSPSSACLVDCTANTCGDGVKGLGEQCDEGDNNGKGNCSGDCTLPQCGNGISDPGEACDDGDQNDNAASCKDDCTINVCGDGFVRKGVEECDDGNTNDGDGCHGDCTAYKVVFLSSMAYFGGIEGANNADSRCETLGGKALLEGPFKAWISEGGSPASLRLDPSTIPYRLRDGTLVALNWADLTDGDLAAPINLTEKGIHVEDANAGAWTGTLANGSAAATNCVDWTDGMNTSEGFVGDVNKIDANWTQARNDPCDMPNRFYCIQQ
ncbi:MAG: DUF4215 domain-containing protein [Nannocystaceae bacterium]